MAESCQKSAIRASGTTSRFFSFARGGTQAPHLRLDRRAADSRRDRGIGFAGANPGRVAAVGAAAARRPAEFPDAIQAEPRIRKRRTLSRDARANVVGVRADSG